MLKFKNRGKGQLNGFTGKNITFEAEPAQKRAKKAAESSREHAYYNNV